MPKWNKMLLPPQYMSHSSMNAKKNTGKEAQWPPDFGNSSREYTDEEIAEMEKKGIRVKRASK